MTELTRRRFLATIGVGTATLAGCSSLPWDDEPERSYDRETLQAVGDLGVPAVPRRSPAPIEPSYLDARRATIRERLDAVPSPIPASDVPNEVVRSQVTRLRSRAVDALARAESATTGFDRMGDLRSALGSATATRAGYRAVTEGLTRAATLADRPAVRADVRAFRDRRRVVGGIDAATVVLQGTVERFLRIARDQLDRADEQRHARGRTMVVAETAETVAESREYLADARHLSDRFRTSRETRPVGKAFERAGDVLLADVRRRHDALPGQSFTDDPASHLDVSGDLAEPARVLVADAFREAAWDNDPGEASGEGTASRLLAAHRADHALRTFAQVRRAVEAGDHGDTVEAGTVREAKLDALAAFERARSDPGHRALTSVAAGRVVTLLRRGDHYLADLAEDYGDPSEVVASAYAAYVRASVSARTIAPANAWIVGAIEAAAGRERTDG